MRLAKLEGVTVEVDGAGRLDLRLPPYPPIYCVEVGVKVGRDLLEWLIERGANERVLGDHYTLRQYLKYECRERQGLTLDEITFIRLFRALMDQEPSKTLGELLDGPAFISATLPKMEGQG